MTSNNSTEQCLQLLGRVFHFSNSDPIHPMQADLGKKRVVSLIFHLSDPPELGLSELGSDYSEIDYYPITQLDIVD